MSALSLPAPISEINREGFAEKVIFTFGFEKNLAKIRSTIYKQRKLNSKKKFIGY